MRDLVAKGDVTAPKLSIAVIGLGHVGLPTALGLAELGWKVIGTDQDVDKVRLLKEGKSPFFEPKLDGLLTKHLATGKFAMTTDVADAIRSATILFICVGTPQRESGEADLSQVEVIGRLISQNLNGYKLIVEKSTVPANTAQWLKRTIARYALAHARSNGGSAKQAKASPYSVTACAAPEFDIASNPEFLQEGKAIENFFRPDRIILGVENHRSEEMLKAIYRSFKRPILVTDLATAELIKHAANVFLAMKISYANMVADICEAVGANVTMVSLGLGLDPRIGPDFLAAGIGFGGYCFPKDLKALIHLAEEYGVSCSILREVERINQQRVQVFLKKLHKALWILQEKTIALWGLAFKPNTDDVREAPSVKIIDELLKEGARLRLYDPQAMPNMQRIFPEQAGQIVYCSSSYEACDGAHALLLLTEWDEFRNVNLRRVSELMDLPILLDGRNIFEPEKVCEVGMEYISVGRGGLKPSPAPPLGLTIPPVHIPDPMESLRS